MIQLIRLSEIFYRAEKGGDKGKNGQEKSAHSRSGKQPDRRYKLLQGQGAFRRRVQLYEYGQGHTASGRLPSGRHQGHRGRRGICEGPEGGCHLFGRLGPCHTNGDESVRDAGPAALHIL